jgi:hypothetical protein
VIVGIKVHTFEYRFYVFFRFIALEMLGEELNCEVINSKIFPNSHIMSLRSKYSLQFYFGCSEYIFFIMVKACFIDMQSDM